MQRIVDPQNPGAPFLTDLECWASLSNRAPHRVDLDEIVLAIVEVVDVEARLCHEYPLDQLASRAAVDSADLGGRAQQCECLLELIHEEFLRGAMLAPPFVLCFEPPLGFSEKDDLHGALGAV